MKSKHISSILLAAILGQVYGVAAYAGPPDSAPAADVAKPEVDAVDLIVILAHSGWILHVRLDGSGRLQYGSGPTDGAIFAAGSIDFNKVFTHLPQHGEDTGEKILSRCLSNAEVMQRRSPAL